MMSLQYREISKEQCVVVVGLGGATFWLGDYFLVVTAWCLLGLSPCQLYCAKSTHAADFSRDLYMYPVAVWMDIFGQLVFLGVFWQTSFMGDAD